MTQAVGSDPMTASVALTPVAWGTALDLTCSYPTRGPPIRGRYLRPGRAHQGRPDRTGRHLERTARQARCRSPAATAARQTDIASVEVTKLDGSPVARLTL